MTRITRPRRVFRRFRQLSPNIITLITLIRFRKMSANHWTGTRRVWRVACAFVARRSPLSSLAALLRWLHNMHTHVTHPGYEDGKAKATRQADAQAHFHADYDRPQSPDLTRARAGSRWSWGAALCSGDDVTESRIHVCLCACVCVSRPQTAAGRRKSGPPAHPAEGRTREGRQPTHARALCVS
jgi:hypothetical protein